MPPIDLKHVNWPLGDNGEHITMTNSSQLGVLRMERWMQSISVFFCTVSVINVSCVSSDQKPTEICPLSQEVRSETSSNPSSPEICPNKER